MEAPFIFSDETENFRSPCQPASGEGFTLRLRAGQGAEVSVFLCLERDGKCCEEPLGEPRREGIYRIWETAQPGVREKGAYYFRLEQAGECAFYGKNGLSGREEDCVPFMIRPGFRVPAWAQGACWYQIFPDRFLNGDPDNDVETGELTDELGNVSRKCLWQQPVAPRDVSRFYGGDLRGILNKLDYLRELGVEVLYLNPIFLSPSNHKYNVQDYRHVDPHLGVMVRQGEGRSLLPENLTASDALLAELSRELHARGMRLVLDCVFNHCSAFHPWMDRGGLYREQGKGAWERPDSPYRDYFSFAEDGSYRCWWDNLSLPKLRIADGRLREELLEIARHWLRAPYAIDGWRLDVAADLGDSPAENHAFWQAFRQAVRAENPEALILAEHYGDPSPWLQGGEWDSVMNYDGFMEPVSFFFTGIDKHSDRACPALKGDGEAFRRSMELAEARLPKAAHFAALNQLDNHDHSRFLTRTGGLCGRLAELGSEAAEEQVSVPVLRQAVLLQFCFPGAPGVYYGDEAGLCGFTDPDNRRPYPWGSQDWALLDFYHYAIRLRRQSPVLKRGSFLWLRAERDLIAFARFLNGEALAAVFMTGGEGPAELDLTPVTGKAPRSVIRLLESRGSGYNVGHKEERTPEGRLRLTREAAYGAVFTWREEQAAEER